MEENSKINVMLVDDEDGFRKPMEYWLKAQGYKVLSFRSGIEALEALKECVPDVIYLDMRMPEMDGIETLRRIRMQHPDLPVIMITAYGSEESMAKAEEMGVTGFFSKGDDFVVAAKLIRAAIESNKEKK